MLTCKNGSQTLIFLKKLVKKLKYSKGLNCISGIRKSKSESSKPIHKWNDMIEVIKCFNQLYIFCRYKCLNVEDKKQVKSLIFDFMENLTSQILN